MDADKHKRKGELIMANSKVIQVIKTESCEGKGTEDDIYRMVTEYFTLEGELIMRHDPTPDGKVPAANERNNNH